MIEAYHFGQMAINGKVYTSDLIIYPDGTIADAWWRKQGHRLTTDDIRQLIQARPEIIVAGTGDSGLMKPAPGLQEKLESQAIRFIARPTGEAKDCYNRLQGQYRVGACFHLTC